MRKLAYLIGLSWLVCASALGQEERTTTDLTLGYSYIRANPATRNSTDFNIHGGTADVALNPRSWFGVVGNFGGYHMNRFDSSLGTYLFGPRVYLPTYRRATPFAESLFGLAHTTGGAGFSLPGSRNSFAMAPGGGLDVAASKHLSLRLGEVNYLMTNFRELPGVGRQVQNNVRVTGRGGSSLHIYRTSDGSVVASGSIGRSAAVRRLQLTVADPPLFTGGALRAALAARGITVDGQLRTGKTPPNATVVAEHKSPPLGQLLAAMNRESINHFAELIFRNAVRGPRRDTVGAAETGNVLLQHFMTTKARALPNAVSVTDGCGLSVLDRITPRAMVELLSYAHGAPWSSVFHASLPVAGESELLRNRMKFTPAAGNLHAKTGTTNDVIGLGGYVTAEDGEVLAFSFLFNGHDRWNARATIDRMGATMAAFSR